MTITPKAKATIPAPAPNVSRSAGPDEVMVDVVVLPCGACVCAPPRPGTFTALVTPITLVTPATEVAPGKLTMLVMADNGVVTAPRTEEDIKLLTGPSTVPTRPVAGPTMVCRMPKVDEPEVLVETSCTTVTVAGPEQVDPAGELVELPVLALPMMVLVKTDAAGVWELLSVLVRVTMLTTGDPPEELIVMVLTPAAGAPLPVEVIVVAMVTTTAPGEPPCAVLFDPAPAP